VLKKIVIIGPESSGKTTLCEQLSQQYKAMWCPEFARSYLMQHGKNYSYDDLLTIAKGQLQLEEEYIKKAADGQFLFIDTDMYVMKVWCEFVFGKCHQWILDRVTERTYDLYLLCKPDLPWIKDALREYPDEERRIKLFHYYKDVLVNQSTPWVEINGSGSNRLDTAVNAIELLLQKSPESAQSPV
jgi:NadR type nicotinamide-nucleotide adenylyltransferase